VVPRAFAPFRGGAFFIWGDVMDGSDGDDDDDDDCTCLKEDKKHGNYWYAAGVSHNGRRGP
jgi:hypothetical protein